jgi:hypothetical protein
MTPGRSFAVLGSIAVLGVFATWAIPNAEDAA